MDKEAVMALLREIKYPGYSRDLVSFGVVRDVDVQDDTVTVALTLTTQDPEKKQAIVGAVRTALEGRDGISAVRITEAPPPGKPGAPGARPSGGEMWSGQVRTPGVGETIAVASGKGGVGKSTVAANLAMAVSARGFATGLLDCDIYGPSVPTIMGINEKPMVGEGRKIIPLDRHGLKIMSLGFILDDDSPVIWRGPIVSKLITQFVTDINWGELDYLILDLPPGTGDVQLTLAQKVAMSGAVIVTTPQDLALLDADKGAKMFRTVNTPVLGIVENMSAFVCPHCGEEADIFGEGGGEREALRLGVPFLGKIPIDPRIRESGDAGRPILLYASDSPAVEAYSHIADVMLKVLEAASVRADATAAVPA